MLDRLFDVLLIQIVRYAIEKALLSQGILAGLAHPRLSRALSDILNHPGQSWTLDQMAALTHQSRTAFVRSFPAHLFDTRGWLRRTGYGSNLDSTSHRLC